MCRCGGSARNRNRNVSVPAPAPAPGPTRAIQPVVEPTSTPPSRVRMFRRRVAAEPAQTFHMPIVDTKVWGPRLWFVLHTASVAIPFADVWPRLVEELKMGLPCPDCTGHYTAWAVAQPVTAATDISAWFLALHNDVNRRAGSGVGGWTCEQLTATYTGRFADARAALDGLRGIIGEAVWATLDAVLVAAMTPPVVEPVPEV